MEPVLMVVGLLAASWRSRLLQSGGVVRNVNVPEAMRGTCNNNNSTATAIHPDRKKTHLQHIY